jgi:L-ascorbate metabolism protein UlaG (beta-lactamase superfamily)
MKIKFLAHAAFLITAASGTRILTDPYTTNERHRHADIKETAEIVTVSHGHGDHNNVAAVKGNPLVLDRAGAEKGVRDKTVKIKSVATAHDDAGGSKRGPNLIFCFEVDGVKICHCGDLGHLLTDAQLKAIGAVDVLMVPVGGFFTIDAAGATRVCDQLKAKIILPMHYKTDKIGLPIAPVDDFLKGKSNVKRSESSEIEVKAGQLPALAEIIVLKPAL